MAKVLLVDTNFSSVPIYRALLAEGHEVHVVGGNPSDCLARKAPNYWQLDYSDAASLSVLVDKQGFDCLVPGCTDRSYASCVAVGHGRFPGLDSPSAMSAINHKGELRRVAAALGLPVPELFSDPDDAIGRPVIVKPVDSFSGKGIAILPEWDRDTIGEAIANARASSPTGGSLIEEFVAGQLYSHSAFLVGHKVLTDFLVQEDGTANRFVVDTSRVLDTSRHRSLVRSLRGCVETLARHLRLADGLLHTQFIAADSRIWLIETTRRCPGDLYSQLVELSTDYPYAKSYALPFLGRAPLEPQSGCMHPVMRHTISVPTEQAFDHVRFLREVWLERYVPLALVGDALAASPRSRVAVVFCRERDQDSLDELYATTLRRELYAISDGIDPIGRRSANPAA